MTTKKRLRPILLLELNEIPWRLVDRYKNHPKLKNLKTFLEHSDNYTTVSTDVGELSPWITWPSFHRGINNIEHGIKNLGQNPKSFKGRPIWDEFLERGYNIGLMGSLQSWPAKNPGPMGFYVPDTFAQDSACFPRSIGPVQKFNLLQVKNSTRVASDSLPKNKILFEAGKSMLKSGLKCSTAAKIAFQLVLEKFNPLFANRRPMFQTLIFWDIFKKLYSPINPPAFSTFFTNHVASAMHRYWNCVFPEDFSNNQFVANKIQKEMVLFGLKIVDSMLGTVLKYLEKNPKLIVAVASSMGQDSSVRENHLGHELSMKDSEKLLNVFKLNQNFYTPLLAMTPQFAFEATNEQAAEKLATSLNMAKMHCGRLQFDHERIDNSFSITIQDPRPEDIDKGGFLFEESLTTWEQAGMKINKVDPGTGYHIPEGILAICGRDIPPCPDRKQVDLTSIKSKLLSLSGI